jgi:hypothetical protein
VLLVSGAVFCLVYGFSNAATHGWHAPSTWGFLAAGVALLAAFAFWMSRAAHPLLPPRVVLDRNRGGAYLSMLIASAGLFGIFLFLTYYLQQTLGYSPLVTGVAFLPISGGLILASNLSTIVLMPRFGPKPLVASGMLAAAGAMVWLAQLGPHTGYAVGVLGPIILAAVGVGMVIAPVINTGTFGVAPQDAGVASATVTVGQQLGASVGTSLLNTIFTAAVTSYLAANLAAARLIGRPALTGLALAHGYDTAFSWTAGIFAVGAVGGGTLLRRGPLRPASTPPPARRSDNCANQGRPRPSRVMSWRGFSSHSRWCGAGWAVIPGTAVRRRRAPAAAVPQTRTRMPYRPSGAAAAGPKAAVARPAAMAKSRIDVASSRAAATGRGARSPRRRPITADASRKTTRAAATVA